MIIRLTNETDGKKTNKEIIVEEQIKLAKGGDKNAVAWLANREDGMPSQYIEQTQKSDTTVRVIE